MAKQFEYKDIDKLNGLLKHDFLVMYTRGLQEHALALEKEIAVTRENRAKDGNRFYQSDAKKDRDECRQLYSQIGRLEGQIATLEGKRAGELERQKGRYEGQLERQKIMYESEIEELKKQIASLKEHQIIEIVPDQEKKIDYRMTDRIRDERGRLLPSGSSKEDRKKLCYKLMEQGMSPEDVASTIGNISPASVKTYYSEYRKDLRKAIADKQARIEAEKAHNAYLADLHDRVGITIGAYNQLPRMANNY